MTGPKFGELLDNPLVETRGYHTRGATSAVGRSWIYIICPFCGESVRTYLWSLAGVGKRCPCGALFGSLGNAYHWKDRS